MRLETVMAGEISGEVSSVGMKMNSSLWVSPFGIVTSIVVALLKKVPPVIVTVAVRLVKGTPGSNLTTATPSLIVLGVTVKVKAGNHRPDCLTHSLLSN